MLEVGDGLVSHEPQSLIPTPRERDHGWQISAGQTCLAFLGCGALQGPRDLPAGASSPTSSSPLENVPGEGDGMVGTLLSWSHDGWGPWSPQVATGVCTVPAESWAAGPAVSFPF